MADKSSADDPHDLTRFVEAQEGVYEQALAEIRAGRKRSHWMWFIFPQIDGLGSSPDGQAVRDQEPGGGRGVPRPPGPGAATGGMRRGGRGGARNRRPHSTCSARRTT